MTWKSLRMDPEPEFGESERYIIVCDERTGQVGEHHVIVGTFHTTLECCHYLASISLDDRTGGKIRRDLQKVDYMWCGDIFVERHPFYAKWPQFDPVEELTFSISEPHMWPDFNHLHDKSKPDRGFWGFRDYVLERQAREKREHDEQWAQYARERKIRADS